MTVIKAVKLARRIRRFERRQSEQLAKKLDSLTDTGLLDRALNPDRVLYITPKGEAEGRRLVYSKNRKIIQ